MTSSSPHYQGDDGITYPAHHTPLSSDIPGELERKPGVLRCSLENAPYWDGPARNSLVQKVHFLKVSWRLLVLLSCHYQSVSPLSPHPKRKEVDDSNCNSLTLSTWDKEFKRAKAKGFIAPEFYSISDLKTGLNNQIIGDVLLSEGPMRPYFVVWHLAGEGGGEGREGRGLPSSLRMLAHSVGQLCPGITEGSCWSPGDHPPGDQDPGGAG